MASPVDRNTIDRLVVEHLPAALRFALRLTSDPDVAEDLVQESLCLILRNWRSYRGDASFFTWMVRIVINLERDRRRRQRNATPMRAEQAASGAAAPPEEAAAGELHARVRAAIDRLPDRQREVAILCLGEGLEARDVARALDITEANVHTCLHLARKRIAQTIGFKYRICRDPR